MQYTDALKIVIQESKSEFMYKTAVLNEVLEHVMNLNYSGGKRVLQSLIPVIKKSETFRNSTILVVRKALFSPKVETRRIAINGVLAMLKNFRLSTGFLSNTSTQQMLSQSSSGKKLIF